MLAGPAENADNDSCGTLEKSCPNNEVRSKYLIVLARASDQVSPACNCRYALVLSSTLSSNNRNFSESGNDNSFRSVESVIVCNNRSYR